MMYLVFLIPIQVVFLSFREILYDYYNKQLLWAIITNKWKNKCKTWFKFPDLSVK